MAIIDCKNCGKNISDKALLCPHCGTKIIKAEANDQSKRMTVNGNEVSTAHNKMSNDVPKEIKDTKKDNGCATLFMILGGGIIIMLLIFLLMYTLWGTEETEKATAESTSVKQTDVAIEENSSQTVQPMPSHPFIGTWEYKYPKNWSDYQTLKITINEDETAVANVIRKTVSGEILDKTFYGSWYEANSSNGKTQIQFHFNDTGNYFRGRYYRDMEVCATEGDKYWDATNCVLMDGYLYEDFNQASAKNPEKRVKMSKIK